MHMLENGRRDEWLAASQRLCFACRPSADALLAHTLQVSNCVRLPRGGLFHVLQAKFGLLCGMFSNQSKPFSLTCPLDINAVLDSDPAGQTPESNAMPAPPTPPALQQMPIQLVSEHSSDVSSYPASCSPLLPFAFTPTGPSLQDQVRHQEFWLERQSNLSCW